MRSVLPQPNTTFIRDSWVRHTRAAMVRIRLRRFVERGIEVTLARFPGLLVEHELRAMTRQMLDGKRPLDWRVWRIVN